MNIILKLSKHLSLFVVLLVFIGGSALGLLYKSQYIQNNIRTAVQSQFLSMTGQEMLIGDITGPLLFSATLKDIVIKNPSAYSKDTMATIDALTIVYNPFLALQLRGDIMAAASSITLQSPTVHILRSQGGKWNVLALGNSPLQKQYPPVPHTFRGQLSVDNGTITFTDVRGWEDTPLEYPFTTTMAGVNGYMDFTTFTETQLFLEGLNQSTQQPTSVSGVLNTYSGDYDLRVSASELNADHWGPYLLTVDGFHIIGEKASISGTLKNRVPAPKKGTPFWFDLNITVDGGILDIPFFDVPFTGASSAFKLYNTKNGKHTFGMDIVRFNGNVAGIDGSITGSMNFKKNRIALKAKTKAFDLEAVKTLFPALQTWQFSGRGTSSLTLNGRLSSPTIKGNVYTKAPEFYKLFPTSVTLGYRYQTRAKTLALTLKRGSLFGGQLRGGGTITFTKAEPLLDFTFKGRHMDAAIALPRVDALSGTFNTQILAKGKSTDYNLDATLSTSSIHIHNQHVNSVTASMIVKQYRNIQVENAHIFLNAGTDPLHLDGNIHDLKTASFAYHGDRLSFAALNPSSSAQSPFTSQTEGTIAISDLEGFIERPVDHVSVGNTTMLKDYPLSKLSVETLDIDFQSRKRQLELHHFRAEVNKKTWVQLNGLFQNAIPKRIDIDSNQFPIHDMPLLTPFIPQQLQPFQGFFSGSIAARHHPSSATEKRHHYHASGNVTFKKTQLQNQHFDTMKTKFSWRKGVLTLKDTELFEGKSGIFLNGSYSKKRGLNLNVDKGTFVNSEDFSSFTSPLGLLRGESDVEGSIKGSLKRPHIDMLLDAKHIETYFISLDQAKGHIRYKNKVLSSKGLTLQKTENIYNINGRIDMTPILEDPIVNVSKLNYSLSFDTEKSDLNVFSKFLTSILNEVSYRRGLALFIANEQPVNPNVTLTDDTLYRLKSPQDRETLHIYSRKTNSDVVSYFNTIIDQEKTFETPQQSSFANYLHGTLTTSFKITSRKQSTPLTQGSLTIANAALGAFYTSQLKMNVYTMKRGIHANFSTKQGNMSNTPFTRLNGNGLYTFDGALHIGNIAMSRSTHKNSSFIKGYIPLSAFWNPQHANKKLFLSVNFINDDINLLSMLTPYVERLENTGTIQLVASGTISNPILNAKRLQLQNSVVHWSDISFFQAPFVLTSGQFQLVNNQIFIDNAGLSWRGPETRRKLTQSPVLNTVIVDGKIGLRQLSLVKPSSVFLDFDLKAKDTSLVLNYQNLFNGDVDINQLSIKGPFEIPLSDATKEALNETIATDFESGPVVAGNVTLSNSDITLASNSKGNRTKPPLLLQLNTHIKNNVTLSGALFGNNALSGLASGLELELEETSTPIVLKGSLSAPLIEEDVAISHGSIVVLNRQFDLLTPFEQRPFFKESLYEAQPNSVALQRQQDPLTGKNIMLPILNLTALTILDPINLNNSATDNVNTLSSEVFKPVLVRMNGPVNQLNTFSFDEYENPSSIIREDSLVFISRYDLGADSQTGGSYSSAETNNIVRLLIPELYIDPDEVSGGASQTELIGGALLANQLDLAIKRNFLRPVEKRLAQNIGLYDLRVNYNIGAALINPNNSAQVNRVGVDAVSQIFTNNLFVRVRTDLNTSPDQGQAQQFQLSEVALTYYLLRNVSVNLINGRDQSNEFSQARLSLKVSHEF